MPSTREKFPFTNYHTNSVFLVSFIQLFHNATTISQTFIPSCKNHKNFVGLLYLCWLALTPDSDSDSKSTSIAVAVAAIVVVVVHNLKVLSLDFTFVSKAQDWEVFSAFPTQNMFIFTSFAFRRNPNSNEEVMKKKSVAVFVLYSHKFNNLWEQIASFFSGCFNFHWKMEFLQLMIKRQFFSAAFVK